jgi:hypothetical protein
LSSRQPSLDSVGRRRSSASYPADPPTVDEIVAVIRQAGHDRHGHRLNALIVVLWRAGLRIHEALSLTETDLDQAPRLNFGQARQEQPSTRGRDGCPAWSAIEPWLADRVALLVRALFCVVDGPTRGRAWSASAARVELRHVALKAGVRRRFGPHQLRHADAVEFLHERDRAAADSAPDRPVAPVNDRHLPRGDQHRGDHLDRPRNVRTDDARQRRPRPVAPRERRAPSGLCSPAKQQPHPSDAAVG